MRATAERKQRHDEALRAAESAMDRLRRAASRNETVAARLYRRSAAIESLAPLLEPDEPALTDSGLHELG